MLVQRPGAIETPDRPELDPDRDRATEQRLHLGRPRRRCEVPVEMRVAEEGVADGAADAPGLMSRSLELRGDVEDGLRGVEAGRQKELRRGERFGTAPTVVSF